MENKEIYIDGVDVSGCDELVNECDCYLTEEHDYRATNPYTYNKCSGFPNCNYKQLQRAEQKLEKIKKYLCENVCLEGENCKFCDNHDCINIDIFKIIEE